MKIMEKITKEKMKTKEKLEEIEKFLKGKKRYIAIAALTAIAISQRGKINRLKGENFNLRSSGDGYRRANSMLTYNLGKLNNRSK